MKNRSFVLFVFIVGCLLQLVLLASCADTPKDRSREVTSGGEVVYIDPAFSDKERLGKLLFFEKSLSSPSGQACAACHDPKVAFVDPDPSLPVSRGARTGIFGRGSKRAGFG